MFGKLAGTEDQVIKPSFPNNLNCPSNGPVRLQGLIALILYMIYYCTGLILCCNCKPVQGNICIEYHQHIVIRQHII